MKCQLCKEEVFLPHRCSYCGQYFCDDHRLPEKHLCPGLPKRSWSEQRQKQKIVAYSRMDYGDRTPTFKKKSTRAIGRNMKRILKSIGIGIYILIMFAPLVLYISPDYQVMMILFARAQKLTDYFFFP